MCKFKFSSIIQRFFCKKRNYLRRPPLFEGYWNIIFFWLFHQVLRNKELYVHTSSLLIQHGRPLDQSFSAVILAGSMIGNGRSKGSSILMQCPVTMAHQKSFGQYLSAVNNRQSPHEEDDEEHYASAQSPMFQNHLLGDNNSIHLSTVPGNVP
jgi:hypothetical protein